MQHRRWRWAGGWWLGIMLTAALGRPLVEALREHGALRTTVSTVLVVAAGLVGGLLVRQSRFAWRSPRRWLIWASLATVGAAAAFLERPEERLHLVQFGVLGGLLTRAAGPSPFGLAAGAVAAALGGWVDEVWQSFLPRRVYDVDDIVLNIAAALAGVLIARLAQDAREPPPPTDADKSSR